MTPEKLMEAAFHQAGDKIFGYLGSPDLLNSSLVLKQWNRRARDVLRKKQSCLFYVGLTTDVREALQQAVSLLAKAPSLPYSGLWLDFSRNQQEGSEEHENVAMGNPGDTNTADHSWDEFTTAASSLNIGHLRVQIRGDLDASSAHGLRKIFQCLASELCVLEVDIDASEETVESIGLETLKFPKLEELQYGSDSGVILMFDLLPYGKQDKLLEKIVENSPRLRTVTSYFTAEWCKLSTFKMLEERGLVQAFDCSVVRSSPWDWYTRSLKHTCVEACVDFEQRKPKLSKLRHSSSLLMPLKFGCGFQAVCYAQASHAMERIRDLLLRSNSDCVEELTTTRSALSSMCDSGQLPVLRKLRKLIVDVECNGAEQIKSFSSIDFEVYFPELQQLVLRLRYSLKPDTTKIPRQLDAFTLKPSKTVQTLVIEDPPAWCRKVQQTGACDVTRPSSPKRPSSNSLNTVSLDDIPLAPFSGLGKMFPNLQHLKLKTPDVSRIRQILVHPDLLPSLFPKLETVAYELETEDDMAGLDQLNEINASYHKNFLSVTVRNFGTKRTHTFLRHQSL